MPFGPPLHLLNFRSERSRAAGPASRVLRFQWDRGSTSIWWSIVDGGDWIGLAGVVVAAGSAVLAAVAARKAGRSQTKAEEQARESTVAAERAADAQARSAGAAERSATAESKSADAAVRAAAALERQLQVAEDQADLAEGVPWRLEWRSGTKFNLWNSTDSPKFDVRIEGTGVARARTVERIDGQSSVDFTGNIAWVKNSHRVDVTWHRREDHSDEPRRWTGSTPPRG